MTNPLACFKWSVDGSGLDSIVGLPHYGTRREAERAWRHYRRTVWANQPRFTVPRPARYYDGLTMGAREFLWHSWNIAFELVDALEALAVDRANLSRFAARREARAISDYLAVFAADLDRIERTVQELATFTPAWQRPFPSFLTTGLTYGHPQAEGGKKDRDVGE